MKIKYAICFLSFGLVFFNLHGLPAKELEREAKVLFVKGEVQVLKAGKGEWTAAKKDMLLVNGDSAKTGKDSAVEISFDNENRNIVRLEENSTAVLRGKMLTQVELPQGRIRSLVKNLKKGSSFEVKTPTIIAGARGSGWDVSTTERRDNVKAFEDEIFVQAYDRDGKLIKEIFVREGWEVMIDRFQAPGELIELTARDRRDWNTWREDLNDRLQAGGRRDTGTPGGFENVQAIEEAVEKREDFKQDTFETEDIRKIEDRIRQDNIRGDAGSSGPNIPNTGR